MKNHENMGGIRSAKIAFLCDVQVAVVLHDKTMFVLLNNGAQWHDLPATEGSILCSYESEKLPSGVVYNFEGSMRIAEPKSNSALIERMLTEPFLFMSEDTEGIASVAGSKENGLLAEQSNDNSGAQQFKGDALSIIGILLYPPYKLAN
ncbi:MAG: hypothetical protein ACRCZB_05905 [Bacteroidales bacterium]